MKKFKFTEDYVKVAKMSGWNKDILEDMEAPLKAFEVKHVLSKSNNDHVLFSKITSLEFEIK